MVLDLLAKMIVLVFDFDFSVGGFDLELLMRASNSIGLRPKNRSRELKLSGLLGV